MPRIESKTDASPRIDLEFEDNSPYQEGVITETYQKPDRSYLQEPKELENLVNMGRLVQKFLLKQVDIDNILKIIQWKIIKGTHLPVTVREIRAGYLVSFYFKDLFLYLAQNKLPGNKTAIRKVKALAGKYILLDSSFFKIVPNPDKAAAVLLIPEVCPGKIITLNHSSLFTGHQVVIKTYLTISNKFLIPNLIHYLNSHIKGCHICLLSCNEKPPARQLQTRINLNYRLLSRLSMDLTVMPKSHKRHKYILHIIDEVTNYLIMVPIYHWKMER